VGIHGGGATGRPRVPEQPEPGGGARAPEPEPEQAQQHAPVDGLGGDGPGDEAQEARGPVQDAERGGQGEGRRARQLPLAQDQVPGGPPRLVRLTPPPNSPPSTTTTTAASHCRDTSAFKHCTMQVMFLWTPRVQRTHLKPDDVSAYFVTSSEDTVY
jgi:hypothetical protein